MKYSNQAVARPTLVFGTDVSEMSPDSIIAAIKSNNASIKALMETGITSPYIDEKVKGLEDANAVLVEQLGTFATKPSA